MPQDDPGLRILVVEDEAIVRLVIVDALTDLGFQVEECDTIAAVQHRIRCSERIDGMVIDVGLPDGRGDRFALELRSLHPTLPIVLCTGYDDSTLHDFSNDAFVAVCPKPCDFNMISSFLTRSGVRHSVDQSRAA